MAYGRDFSALSGGRGAALLPAAAAGVTFPADLVRASGLEFSGMYEDGWVSPECGFPILSGRARKRASRSGSRVTFPSFCPVGRLDGDFGLSRLSADQSRRIRLRSAGWDISTALLSRSMRRARDPPGSACAFTAAGSLPKGDDRPVGAKLELLEIGPAPPNRSDFATAGSTRPAAEGVDQDGWARADSTVYLSVPSGIGSVDLEVESPGWRGAPSDNTLRASIDQGPAMVLGLEPGKKSIRLPIESGPVVHSLHLHAAKTSHLPAPDERERSLLAAFALRNCGETASEVGRGRWPSPKLRRTGVFGCRTFGEGGWARKLNPAGPAAPHPYLELYPLDVAAGEVDGLRRATCFSKALGRGRRGQVQVSVLHIYQKRLTAGTAQGIPAEKNLSWRLAGK